VAPGESRARGARFPRAHMSLPRCPCLPILLTTGFLTSYGTQAADPPRADAPSAFAGSRAGEERTVAGVKLCWCPPGKFVMGSPRTEPERRPGEDQVEVTLTRGFWMAKYEATQGQWKRAAGPLPGPLTEELPEGDDYP